MQASGKPWQHYANVLVKIAFIAVFVYGGFGLTERFHFGWIEQLIFWPVLAIVGYWLVIREVAPFSLPATSPQFNPELFIYIKIPESVGPLDRGSKYEDPLDLRLTEAGVGNVSDGGSQLGDERPDGTRLIEFCGIDVDTSDLSRALDVVRRELLGLKAPEGTQIHYTQRGIRLQDELRPTGWLVAQPRSFLHPGFGC